MKKNTTHNQALSPLGSAGERLIIYHNTRCAKSREVCSILQNNGVEFETIAYLKTPPTQQEIKVLLKILGMKADAIVRKGEPLYKQKFATKKLSESEWIKALAENPILIARPIIIKGNKAVIGRPPEKVLDLLK